MSRRARARPGAVARRRARAIALAAGTRRDARRRARRTGTPSTLRSPCRRRGRLGRGGDRARQPHGSGHSEAILTRDTDAARAFQLGVDAACVYVNASTRFTDGGEFGMGAEIGNSTQKLHARGRSACASCARSSTSSTGTGTPAPEPPGGRRSGNPGGDVQPPAQRAPHGRPATPPQALASERVLLMPTGVPPHKARPARIRAPSIACACVAVGGRARLLDLRPRGRARGAVLHRRYACAPSMPATRTSS